MTEDHTDRPTDGRTDRTGENSTGAEPGKQVELVDVTRTYGDVRALDSISLTLGGGEFHCLLGPNGSGKSTLFRLLLGLTRPTAGRVETGDCRLACGFQRPNFYPDLTVRENISVFARLIGGTDWEFTRHVVEKLRLQRALDRRAGDLSGGFARKLDLTLALLKQPDLLLLDEPLGALDDVSTAQLLDLLERYAGGDKTVVVSTHRVTAFEPFLDRVTVLHDGTIVLDERLSALDREGDSVQSYYVEQILDREGVSDEVQQVVSRRIE